jgi:hypothetical protein
MNQRSLLEVMTVKKQPASLLLPVAALVAVTASACRNEVGGGSTGTKVDTLPGGRIVALSDGSGGWDSAGAWQIVEDVRITATNAPGAVPFSWINGFEADHLGRVYVSNFRSRQVMVFDSTGAFVRTISRQGKGPGELEEVSALAWDPQGRLVIADEGSGRFIVFDTSGKFVAEHERRRPRGRINATTTDPSGSLVELIAQWGDTEGRRFLIRYDSALMPVDTIHLPPDPWDLYSFAHPKTGAVNSETVPFAGQPTLSLAPGPRVWIGRTSAYRLSQVNSKGDTMRIVERTGLSSVPVTPTEREAAIADLKWFTDMGGRADLSRVPNAKPRYVDFVVDDLGNLWVEPTRETNHAIIWEVFDPDGRYLGRVSAPFSLAESLSAPKALIRGDRIYAVVNDKDGGVAMALAHIVRPSR